MGSLIEKFSNKSIKAAGKKAASKMHEGIQNLSDMATVKEDRSDLYVENIWADKVQDPVRDSIGQWAEDNVPIYSDLKDVEDTVDETQDRIEKTEDKVEEIREDWEGMKEAALTYLLGLYKDHKPTYDKVKDALFVTADSVESVYATLSEVYDAYFGEAETRGETPVSMEEFVSTISTRAGTDPATSGDSLWVYIEELLRRYFVEGEFDPDIPIPDVDLPDVDLDDPVDIVEAIIPYMLPGIKEKGYYYDIESGRQWMLKGDLPTSRAEAWSSDFLEHYIEINYPGVPYDQITQEQLLEMEQGLGSIRAFYSPEIQAGLSKFPTLNLSYWMALPTPVRTDIRQTWVTGNFTLPDFSFPGGVLPDYRLDLMPELFGVDFDVNLFDLDTDIVNTVSNTLLGFDLTDKLSPFGQYVASAVINGDWDSVKTYLPGLSDLDIPDDLRLALEDPELEISRKWKIRIMGGLIATGGAAAAFAYYKFVKTKFPYGLTATDKRWIEHMASVIQPGIGYAGDQLKLGGEVVMVGGSTGPHDSKTDLLRSLLIEMIAMESTDPVEDEMLTRALTLVGGPSTV